MPLGSAEALALTGMMGSGKSSVAAWLGRWLRRPVLSTDAEVVRLAGKPIARIFAEEGEAAFRALERRVAVTVAGALVADLGGGTFCDPAGAARLLRTARVVFLDVSAAEAARRLGGDGGVRPLASDWDRLLGKRLPLYARAHHRIAVDGLAPEAIARLILDVVRVGGAAGPASGWLGGRGR